MPPQRKRVWIQDPGPRHWSRVLLNIVVTSAAGGLLATVIASFFMYHILSLGLPKIDKLADYRPNLVSEVYDRNGVLIGEFMWENQRRYLVKVEEVPLKVIQAFISAEDKGFFSHQGLDYWSIFRAAWANLASGEIKQGGSTITQQVVKSLLLTPEKTYTRKMREIILAKRIEDRLTKTEILYLYLNQIYFGSGSYGIQAAANDYFGKNVGELKVEEAALLAGLVQAPGRYNPRAYPDRALGRRRYVLQRMYEDGHLTDAEYKQADATPLRIHESNDLNREKAPHFVEHVRRYLMKKYGVDRVLKDGLRITTTCDLKLQRVAHEAAVKGLRNHAKRQGLLVVPETVARTDWPKATEQLKRRNDLKGPTEVREGLVALVDDVAGVVKVDLGGPLVRIPFAEMKWVTKVERGGQTKAVAGLTRPGQLLRPGDRVATYRANAEGDYVLAAWPAAETAFLAMDIATRQVLAMVGGKNFDDSEFNRMVQAKRQPGSAFKPIVYGAAVNAGMTTATVFADTALVFADNWRPANYDRKFRGYMSLREALTKSINTVTIRVAQAIGVDYLVRFANRLGIRSIRTGDLSMAIGTYEVTPLELINAYAVYASGGLLMDPVFVKKVTDRDGQVIEEAAIDNYIQPAPPLAGVPDLRNYNDAKFQAAENPETAAPDRDHRLAEILKNFGLAKDQSPTPAPTPPEVTPTEEEPDHRTVQAREEGKIIRRQVLSPQVSYIVTSMMHSVATEGTGARSNALDRMVAGKTGTTNDYADAWFIGFSPHILAGVWIGYDQGGKTLGGGESGSTTALPVWIDFMQTALTGETKEPFAAPAGIVFARIDPDTGLLARPDSPGREEVFIAGTEPTEYAPSASAPRPADFFDIEYDEE
ncbi:MAG: penicillin-binding protein [Myxococcales bacterium]|nr:penicillin-binding protein [Myxococcales bacterium]